MLDEIYKTLRSYQGAPLQEKVPNKVPNKIPNKLKKEFPNISDATWDVYRTLKSNHSASSEEIGAILGISSRMVRKHIACLREAGIIVRVGSNKTGHWEIIKYSCSNVEVANKFHQSRQALDNQNQRSTNSKPRSSLEYG